MLVIGRFPGVRRASQPRRWTTSPATTSGDPRRRGSDGPRGDPGRPFEPVTVSGRDSRPSPGGPGWCTARRTVGRLPGPAGPVPRPPIRASELGQEHLEEDPGLDLLPRSASRGRWPPTSSSGTGSAPSPAVAASSRSARSPPRRDRPPRRAPVPGKSQDRSRPGPRPASSPSGARRSLGHLIPTSGSRPTDLHKRRPGRPGPPPRRPGGVPRGEGRPEEDRHQEVRPGRGLPPPAEPAPARPSGGRPPPPPRGTGPGLVEEVPVGRVDAPSKRRTSEAGTWHTPYGP
jgi:hypothetical protein